MYVYIWIVFGTKKYRLFQWWSCDNFKKPIGTQIFATIAKQHVKLRMIKPQVGSVLTWLLLSIKITRRHVPIVFFCFLWHSSLSMNTHLILIFEIFLCSFHNTKIFISVFLIQDKSISQKFYICSKCPVLSFLSNMSL